MSGFRKSPRDHDRGHKLAATKHGLAVHPIARQHEELGDGNPTRSGRTGYLDFGVAGGDLSNYTTPGTSTGQSAIGYARVIIPIGPAPKRLDCARLYDLEIARLKAEIEMLKVGLQ